MTVWVPIALFGWIPFVLLGFTLLSMRRAILIAILGGWLFLPNARYSLPGFPDFGKAIAVSIAAGIGVILFDARRIVLFRPQWCDFPILAFCFGRIATSITNGLGVYDGLSWTFTQSTTWLIPYMIGRLYFRTSAALRELMLAVFIGGLIYVPLCLFEIRLSPQLHRIIYGYYQHTFAFTRRFGGFRPMVFLEHGLALGLWMSLASIAGYWLWRTGSISRLAGWPVGYFVGLLIVTSLLCKSTGAMALLALGLLVLEMTRRWKSAIPTLLLLALVPTYCVSRGSGLWSGESLVAAARLVAGNERANSLNFRMRNEDRLAERALERPLLGWGRWGRNRVFDQEGRDTTITDGLWIITLGQSGILGLGMILSALSLPILLAVRMWPVSIWSESSGAGIGCAVVVLVLFLLDSLLNAVPNPAYMLIAGALVAVSLQGASARGNRGTAHQMSRFSRRTPGLVAPRAGSD
jgi:hypothetical protein